MAETEIPGYLAAICDVKEVTQLASTVCTVVESLVVVVTE